MNEASAPPVQTTLRAQTLTGAHDLNIGTMPPVAFLNMVRGAGCLVLANPERYIPYHAIVQFEVLPASPGSALAQWLPTGSPT